MIGAIIGDISGSRFEFSRIKSKEFPFLSVMKCFITDDSLMTIAIGRALLRADHNWDNISVYAIEEMKKIGRKYPYGGYGSLFSKWLKSESSKPYNSYGNGAPMRVSACGFVGKDLDEVKLLARKVTEVTHNHPEGLKAAEATAVAIFLARNGYSKKEMFEVLRNYYPMRFRLDHIRAKHQFTEDSKLTMPPALVSFFESTSFEDAIRNAISLGGDADTLAAITGSIASAYYGVPNRYALKIGAFMTDDLYQSVINFQMKYPTKLTAKPSIDDPFYTCT